MPIYSLFLSILRWKLRGCYVRIIEKKMSSWREIYYVQAFEKFFYRF